MGALPGQLKQSWFEAVRVTSPALTPAKNVYEAADVAAEARTTTASPRTKRSRPATPLGSEGVDVCARAPAGVKRDGRALPICVICQEVPVRLKVSTLCGHFACEPCWHQWFTQCFECPVCRKRVRPTNLIRLRGWGDD